jgi:type VI secretion system protein
MALQVTLTKTPETISEFGTFQTVHTFGAQGGTLGRSNTNTWILPDPDRFLSSCHCEIIFADNQFYIVDLSTNGTFVNGSPEPLGKGVKARLQDGDTFDIGDYRFSVKSVTSPSAEISPFGSADFAGAHFSDGVNGPGISPFADPFAPSPPSSAEFALSPEGENTDPLLALDLAGGSPGAETETSGIFGTFGREQSVDPFAGMGEVDQTPGMDQAVSWPNSSPQNLIPDDWEDDLLTPAPEARTPSRPDTVALVDPSPVQPPPETPVLRQTPVPVQGPGSARADRFDSPDPASINPGARQVATPKAEAAKATVPEQRSPAATLPGRADRRFVAAMGLDAEVLSDEQVNAINEQAGQLMREIVEGMMQVLRSRTSIKNEFRMNVTTIEPFENNPLKFSVGVDEALENMFIKRSKAYKEPLEAFRESFQEIGEHQLAMIAGIRLGFEKMMTRFDPVSLQELFTKQGKGSALPGVQKAKYWTSYCDYYSGFSDNMESSFQNLFGSDFVQAYEDQLRKIAASRKKKQS